MFDFEFHFPSRRSNQPQSPAFHYAVELSFTEIKELIKAAYRITPSVARKKLIEKLDLAERRPGPCPAAHPFDWDKLEAEARRRGPRWGPADVLEGWKDES